MKMLRNLVWVLAIGIGYGGCDKVGTGMVDGPSFVRPDVDEDDDEVFEDPEMNIVNLFIQGEDDYHSYRIPSLVTAANGNLIAFAEGRRQGSHDWGDIDLVYKLSYDHGETWSDLKIAVDEGEGTWGNPTAVTDKETGRIWLFLSWNDEDHSQNGGTFGGKTTLPINTPGLRRVFITYSDDHGETWADPIDHTDTLKPPTFAWDAMGPGVGIQIENGAAKGRLIIPARGRNIYSDDHGVTWHYQRVPQSVSESTIVELNNGLLMRNDRAFAAFWEIAHTRFVSVGSIEGGFSDFVSDPNLPDPRNQASILRYSWSPSRIVFLNSPNPNGNGPDLAARCQMTVRISYDEGTSWEESRLLYPDMDPELTCQLGYGGYSSLTKTGDGRIGALTERNNMGGNATTRRFSIDFHKFNFSWVLDAND